jgi:glycerophosphoryl diester phosphodiesterase
MEIVAHRGASHDAPENTLAAFKLAWEQKADAIEGDFYLTKDQHIVCIHDETTGRVADKDLKVSESNLEDLKALDAGSWKGPAWSNEKIPTIEEVFETIPNGKKIFIEVKCGPEIIPELKTSLENSRLLPEQTVIISFNKEVIRLAKLNIPQVKCFWLTGFRKNKVSGKWEPDIDSILNVLQEIHADGLDCRADDAVTNDFVQSIKDAEMEIHTWTVDDPLKAQELRNLGVESITTNRPGFMRDKLY